MITEKQIIKELQKLRDIKPSQDWVFLVKKDLFFNAEQCLGFDMNKQKMGVWQTLASFFAKPSWALISSGLAVIFLILGGVAYWGWQQSNSQIENLQALVQKFSLMGGDNEQNQKNKEALALLANVQSQINNVKESLTKLQQNRDLKNVLTATQVVKSTARNTQETVAHIEASSNNKIDKQVKVVLEQIKNDCSEIEKTGQQMQIETAKKMIEDLKGKTLNDADAQRLQKAEEYFQQGNLDSAIILLTKIGQ